MSHKILIIHERGWWSWSVIQEHPTYFKVKVYNNIIMELLPLLGRAIYWQQSIIEFSMVQFPAIYTDSSYICMLSLFQRLHTPMRLLKLKIAIHHVYQSFISPQPHQSIGVLLLFWYHLIHLPRYMCTKNSWLSFSRFTCLHVWSYLINFHWFKGVSTITTTSHVY